jgi:hypothetical protein
LDIGGGDMFAGEELAGKLPELALSSAFSMAGLMTLFS